ncbi:hypothetical protein FACS1894116_13240 [Betaproteobacteria bacterium]|nr:hypothetical protein FACS1894116_13240 [Betaproteobacteria bacterium]
MSGLLAAILLKMSALRWLNSQATRDFIEKRYKGAVYSAF